VEDVERDSVASVTGQCTEVELDRAVSDAAPATGGDRKKPDYWADQSENTPAGAQILGVAILEFGILFHSVS
jgi:hypothetical protein